MAIALPYPDMDFVPLDILTAGELNQMVANIEFLANQFPIKNANLDWETIGESIAPATFAPPAPGFSYAGACYVYKIGQYIFAHLIIGKSSNFTSTQEVVATIASAYTPSISINTGGFAKQGEWGTQGVCDVFVSSANRNILCRVQDNTANPRYITIDLFYKMA